MDNLRILSRIALAMIDSRPFNDQVNGVLNIIGVYTGVSRVYVFVDSDDGKTTRNQFEWCNTGIAPQIDDLQNIPYEVIPSWRKFLIEDGMVFSENIATLPDDLRAILEPQNILSIIVFPLYINGEIRGFIGFDECARLNKWSERDKFLLKTISGIISNSYERQSILQRLKRSEDNFKTFFNTINDMVFITDLGGNILHVNLAVYDRLGYAPEEIWEMSIYDFHPQEKRSEVDDIFGDMLKGIRTTCPIELVARNGSLIPVETRIWFERWDDRDCIFGISKDLSKEQESLRKFTKLFENNPALMAISDVGDRRFVDVNSSFLKHLGYSRDEVIGNTAQDLSLFSDPEKQTDIAEKLNRDGRVREIELDIRCNDGSFRHGLFSGEIIETQGSKFFLTVMVDITEQVEMRKSISDQRERLHNVIEGTRLGTWEWNVQTGEVIFNERWAEILGYTLSELKPLNISTWERLAHPDDLAASNDLIAKHFSGESDFYEFESRMKHKNGTWVWVLDRGKVIRRDDKGEPLMMFGTHADITEKKEMEERIRDLSIRDPLTGIYNRRYLFERFNVILNQHARTGTPFAVAMVDIDHFKRINDEYGHLAGDIVLREFTDILSKNLRPYDLLGRYGGEEFLIISGDTVKSQLAMSMARILETVRGRTLRYNDIDIRFTFSGGVTDSTEFDSSAVSSEMIIEKADSRLYRAKEGGRNIIIFE